MSMEQEGFDPYDMHTMLRFLSGDLSAENSERMIQAMNEDPLLLTALEEMDKSGVDGEKLKTETTSFQQNFLEQLREEAPPVEQKSTSWMRYAAAVVALVTIASLSWMLFKPQTFEPYELPDETIRGAEIRPDRVQEGFDLYRERNYKAAATALKSVADDHPLIERVLLVRGNALILSGQTKEAIPVLEKLLGNEDWFVYREEAQRALEHARQSE